MITEVNSLSFISKVGGNTYVCTHGLNPNVESEERLLRKMKEEANINNLLENFNMRGFSEGFWRGI